MCQSDLEPRGGGICGRKEVVGRLWRLGGRVKLGGGLMEIVFALGGISEGRSVGPGDIGKETTSVGHPKSTLINQKCRWV